MITAEQLKRIAVWSRGLTDKETEVARAGIVEKSFSANEFICMRGDDFEYWTGVITGVLLAVARIAGETAPLLFTALSNQFWSSDLGRPMASLPVVIFQFALSPYKDWQALAWTGALIITFAVLALSVSARALSSTRKQS